MNNSTEHDMADNESEEDGEYEEDDDEDIDTHAQETARCLAAELWADISKVNAERNAAPPATPANHTSHTTAPPPSDTFSRKTDAILTTMRAVLALVEKDAQAKSALLSATLPTGPTVLEVLYQCTAVGSIPHGVAHSLSQVVLTLAKSEALFATLRQSHAPAVQLTKGKRKREDTNEGSDHGLAHRRPYVQDVNLHQQVVQAVHSISQALTASSITVLDPNVVSSIQLPLHKVFLFSVTSSAAVGPHMHALQEISGLIQVIGVLSGVQIGHSPEAGPPHRDLQAKTDIGTAVYPCLVPGCLKFFARLYNLRTHQRSHSMHRPYKCSACPASFARNHDLKRHVKLHEKIAWKCQGCQKVFSRRDAIKRHKMGTKSRGPRSEMCLMAEVIEVELDEQGTEEANREERRARIWNEIVENEISVGTVSDCYNPYKHLRTAEEGEVDPGAILDIQATVLTLHPLLQSLATAGLGPPDATSPHNMGDPLSRHATLASVIARAQSQAIPSAYGSQAPIEAQISSSAQPMSEPAMETAVANQGEGVESRPRGDGDSEPVARTLSMYGLSDEQAKLLEVAIANAASAAQALAEAEAELEEEDEDGEYDDEEHDSETGHERSEGPQIVVD